VRKRRAEEGRKMRNISETAIETASLFLLFL
jgi:hypothetical protein